MVNGPHDICADSLKASDQNASFLTEVSEKIKIAQAMKKEQEDLEREAGFLVSFDGR